MRPVGGACPAAEARGATASGQPPSVCGAAPQHLRWQRNASGVTAVTANPLANAHEVTGITVGLLETIENPFMTKRGPGMSKLLIGTFLLIGAAAAWQPMCDEDRQRQALEAEFAARAEARVALRY